MPYFLVLFGLIFFLFANQIGASAARIQNKLQFTRVYQVAYRLVGLAFVVFGSLVIAGVIRLRR